MINMAKITYIIPLHKFDAKIKDYYIEAIESLDKVEHNDDNKIIFVGPSDVIKQALDVSKPVLDVTVVENDETDFFKQINKAVYQCVTPYFTILEIDDKLHTYWNDIMQEYLQPSTSIMLPINEYQRNGVVVSFGNEIAWSSSFANENGKGLGYIDEDCLKAYMDFNVTGGIIKTEDFISIGGLKPSLKIAAWYEFLLRAVYNNKEIFVAPKSAYVHTIGREDSYMENSSKEISQDYGSWLIKTAMQEYFFKNDRNIDYIPTSTANN